MKLPVIWLKEYVDTKMTDKELAEHLTMLGQEVESVETPHDFDKVVVGEVVSIDEHPNADKLHITRVNVGIKDPLQIVCGANNLVIGIKVPVVLVGGKVAGFNITKANLRGVDSFGMICSEKELGLGNDHNGIMILNESDKVGTDFKKTLNAESVIDIKIQPNRPDCMGIWGLAREVAAGQSRLNLPEIKVSEKDKDKTEDIVEIEVDEPTLCPRYMARVVKGVEIKPSPIWLQERLKSVGVRPINNVVDISNYVMFETGQPLHFFDLDKLAKGKKKTKVVIRRARANETIKTLDGTEQKLNSQMLLIADEKEAIAVAGVMGGENSEVDDQTKNILIEAAVFDKTSIRKTSRLLNLRSEAVSRFEKGLPLKLPEVAIDRAGQLLSELAKGRLTKGKVDNLNKWIWVQHLGLSVTRTNQFLGTSIKDQEIVSILQSLGFEASKFDIVDEAKKQLGKPYLYGAKYRINKTDAFDCSYLTDYIYSKIDKQIGHTSLGQLHHGWEVKDSELKAGDILFYKGHIEKSATNEYHDNDGKGNHSKVMTDKYPDGVGHNGLYIGNGQVIHAAAFEYKKEKWQEKAKADQKVEIVPVDYFTKNPEYLGARRYCENLDELVTVTVPWWREDIKCNADLYEEVARIYGYDKVPATLPNMRDILPKNNQNYKFTNNLRQLLSNIGLSEIFTYPFVSGKALSALDYNPDQAPKIANPLLKEQEYLRTSLVPSMLGALSDNQYESEIIQFFEISQIFENVEKKDLPRESKYLCVGIKNDRGEQACFDFTKGVLDRILGEYRIENNNASDEVWKIKILTQGEMDYFGLKKKVAVLEIDLDKIKKIIPKEKTFQTISKYPRVNRDISAIFDKSCPAKEIIDLFKNTSPFIFETSIVDIYEGKPFANNEKSVTVRITLLSFEKTLNDQEIDNVISACIKKIRSIGGKIRDAEQ